MNAFILKIIACITMFIDHIGYAIFNEPSYFNYIGRISFPIFAFQISEGYIHTHSKKKYLLRLTIFAFISQIPFMLFYSTISDDFSLNVIFTLLFGFLSILTYDKLNKFLGVIFALVLGLLAELTKCDYGLYGVLVVFLFYVFNKNKLVLSSAFITSTLVYFTHLSFKYFSYGMPTFKLAVSYYLPYALCTCASLFFILFYNKNKGPNTKHLFYLFYPLHLLLIYAISFII